MGSVVGESISLTSSFGPGTLGWRITGSSSAATANTACVASAGYTGANGGTTTACKADTFKSATGASSCTACPVNSATSLWNGAPEIPSSGGPAGCWLQMLKVPATAPFCASVASL